jgi:hypothetical protein
MLFKKLLFGLFCEEEQRGSNEVDFVRQSDQATTQKHTLVQKSR